MSCDELLAHTEALIENMATRHNLEIGISQGWLLREINFKENLVFNI